MFIRTLSVQHPECLAMIHPGHSVESVLNCSVVPVTRRLGRSGCTGHGCGRNVAYRQRATAKSCLGVALSTIPRQDGPAGTNRARLIRNQEGSASGRQVTPSYRPQSQLLFSNHLPAYHFLPIYPDLVFPTISPINPLHSTIFSLKCPMLNRGGIWSPLDSAVLRIRGLFFLTALSVP